MTGDTQGKGDMPEAKVKWEWTFTPQTVLSAASLFVLFWGLVGAFYQMQSSSNQSSKDIIDLKSAQIALLNAQTQMIERLGKVETKVDIMLPLIQRANENTFSPPRSSR